MGIARNQERNASSPQILTYGTFAFPSILRAPLGSSISPHHWTSWVKSSSPVARGTTTRVARRHFPTRQLSVNLARRTVHAREADACALSTPFGESELLDCFPPNDQIGTRGETQGRAAHAMIHFVRDAFHRIPLPPNCTTGTKQRIGTMVLVREAAEQAGAPNVGPFRMFFFPPVHLRNGCGLWAVLCHQFFE